MKWGYSNLYDSLWSLNISDEPLDEPDDCSGTKGEENVYEALKTFSYQKGLSLDMKK